MSASPQAGNYTPPAIERATREPDNLTRHRRALPALTGVRWIAATYVVLYHSKLTGALSGFARPLANIVANGQVAVSLFFILSGFILSYTYANTHVGKAKRRFWEARFARIWPLYVVSLLAASLSRHSTPPLPASIATLLMVQAWHPFNMWLAAAWNNVCWTLSVEAFFYLLFPFVQVFFERLSRRGLFIALAAVMLVSLPLCTNNISYMDNHGLYGVPLAVLHLPEFFAGMIAANILIAASLRTDNLFERRRSLLGPITLTSVTAILSILLLSSTERIFTTWVTLTFTALVASLAVEPSLLQRVLSTRIAILGGQISYAMYLLQWPCKDTVNWICDRAHLHSAYARFGIFFLFLLVVSWLAFKLVEEPARHIIRKGFARLEAGRHGEKIVP